MGEIEAMRSSMRRVRALLKHLTSTNVRYQAICIRRQLSFGGLAMDSNNPTHVRHIDVVLWLHKGAGARRHRLAFIKINLRGLDGSTLVSIEAAGIPPPSRLESNHEDLGA
jgi:hypothetical protein